MGARQTHVSVLADTPTCPCIARAGQHRRRAAHLSTANACRGPTRQPHVQSSERWVPLGALHWLCARPGRAPLHATPPLPPLLRVCAHGVSIEGSRWCTSMLSIHSDALWRCKGCTRVAGRRPRCGGAFSAVLYHHHTFSSHLDAGGGTHISITAPGRAHHCVVLMCEERGGARRFAW